MEKLEDLYYRLTTEGLVKRDYKRSFEDEGIRIETIIPPVFEGYAKIMIPWSMNVDAPDAYFKEIPFDEIYTDEIDDELFVLHSKSTRLYEARVKEIELKYQPYYLEKKAFEDSIDTRKVKDWRPVTWKEVCEIYEAQYHNDISPNSFDINFKGRRYGLLSSGYSGMPLDLVTPILSVLKKHTKSNLLIWNKLRQVEEISFQQYEMNKTNTPLSYLDIVPKKREWMTCAGNEAYCITIGGTYDFIDDLLQSKDLEVFECTPLSRVDYHSDKINR